MKVGQRSLLGYLPAQVIKCVLDGKIKENQKYPFDIPMKTVSLFADISGFTKLSEKFSKKGRRGPEFLAFCLNRYMELLINIIGKNGGDIFKFAGDALLVIWPASENNDLEEYSVRAFHCAKQIQKKLNNLDMGIGNRLCVKVGLGIGECSIFYVGGTFKRSEYLIVGSAMKQACSAECHATQGGQIIVSEKMYDYLEKYFKFKKCDKDMAHLDADDMAYYLYLDDKDKKFRKIQVKAEALLMRTKFNQEKLANNTNILRTFVPAAITGYLDIEMENWCKELRLLTIMFIQLSVDLKDTESAKGREKIQNVVSTVQVCVYKTRGSLNKFLMDDKGSVMLCCWGLPPFSTPDDSVRAVYSANLILKELKEKYDVKALIGITTGCCFTGVCGSAGGRREYSLLGEIVNLSARYMQTAIMIYEAQKENPEFYEHKGKKSIFLCEKTKNLIQNKIFCEFRISYQLKGFSVKFNHYSPIDEGKIRKISIDSIYQLIKTHKNNKINEKNNRTFEPDIINDNIIGLENEKKIINEKFEEVLRTKESRAILITGIIGSGKSYLLRNQLIELMQKNSDTMIMSNIDKILFISNQSPITHTIQMNGFQESMRKMYSALVAKRAEKYKNRTDAADESDFIYEMIQNSNNTKYIRYIAEILNCNLSKYYSSENEGPVVDAKTMALSGDPFFSPINYEHNKDELTRLSEFFEKLIVEYQNQILKNKLPLIIVVEDSQQLDGLSVRFIMDILFKFTRREIRNVFLICTFQSLVCDLKDNEKEKYLGLNKDLNMTFMSYGTIIEMKPFMKIEDVAELIKDNIKYYHRDEETEKTKKESEMNKKKNGTSGNKDDYIKINLDTIPDEVIKALLPLCIKGSPLFIIELAQALIDQEYILVKDGHILELSQEFKTMLDLRDYRKIKIPFIIEKVLGNIIDSLKCMEIIILKQASVIGNIFDIDILSDLLSTFSTNFDDLFEAIRNFEAFGIIEVLYDLKPKHLVAMFSIPLMREVLYQRLLVEQRADIHSRVARKMEFSKYSYMPKKIEYEILKSHLEASECTLMTSIEEDNMNRSADRISGNLANRKILITKDIIEKLKIVDLKITSSYSEIKKQFMPMLLEANITKKDEHGGKVEKRYAVLTNKKFCYYYNENNYIDNSEPLASFFLKDIYQITILSRDQFDEKSFYLEIKVSSWYKKSEPKEDRDFIIGFSTAEEMSKWEIALNFLRMKNMYDEFTSNFGMIQLPLNNEFSLIESKKYKRKLNIKPRDYKLGGVLMQHSKEEMDGKKKLMDKNSINGKNVGRKKTITNNTLIPDQEKEKTEKKNLNTVDTNAKEIFKYGFGLFLAIIQESISTQKVDYSCAPKHIAVEENKVFYDKNNEDNDDDNSNSSNDSN